LRIGFIKSTAFTPIFPKIINTYRTRFPNVKLVMQEMSTMRQIAALGDYSLDLAFIRPVEPELPSTLAMTTLQEHRLSVLMPDHHRLADVEHLSIDDLRNEDFVMFPQDEGTTLNLEIYRLCAEAGFAPKVTMEAREVATITGLVAARCGIAILPDLFQSLGIKGVLFRPIDTPSVITTLALARRASESGAIPHAFFDIAAELLARQ
jgi:DNA-binding transcriptional LysR family regulator